MGIAGSTDGCVNPVIYLHCDTIIRVYDSRTSISYRAYIVSYVVYISCRTDINSIVPVTYRMIPGYQVYTRNPCRIKRGV